MNNDNQDPKYGRITLIEVLIAAAIIAALIIWLPESWNR